MIVLQVAAHLLRRSIKVKLFYLRQGLFTTFPIFVFLFTVFSTSYLFSNKVKKPLQKISGENFSGDTIADKSKKENKRDGIFQTYTFFSEILLAGALSYEKPLNTTYDLYTSRMIQRGLSLYSGFKHKDRLAAVSFSYNSISSINIGPYKLDNVKMTSYDFTLSYGFIFNSYFSFLPLFTMHYFSDYTFRGYRMLNSSQVNFYLGMSGRSEYKLHKKFSLISRLNFLYNLTPGHQNFQSIFDVFSIVLGLELGAAYYY